MTHPILLTTMVQIVININQRGGVMDLSELSFERALSISNTVSLVAVGTAAAAWNVFAEGPQGKARLQKKKQEP